MFTFWFLWFLLELIISCLLLCQSWGLIPRMFRVTPGQSILNMYFMGWIVAGWVPRVPSWVIISVCTYTLWNMVELDRIYWCTSKVHMRAMRLMIPNGYWIMDLGCLMACELWSHNRARYGGHFRTINRVEIGPHWESKWVLSRVLIYGCWNLRDDWFLGGVSYLLGSYLIWLELLCTPTSVLWLLLLLLFMVASMGFFMMFFRLVSVGPLRSIWFFIFHLFTLISIFWIWTSCFFQISPFFIISHSYPVQTLLWDLLEPIVQRVL